MPEHMLMANVEIITDGGRRRRWSAAEKLRIVEETLEDHASISIVARRNGVAPNLLYRWRRLMLEGGSVAVAEDDEVTSNKVVRRDDGGALLASQCLDRVQTGCAANVTARSAAGMASTDSASGPLAALASPWNLT